MKTPQGVEKVVALATLSPDWRAKVLADPLAAAAEAGIELGSSEREILRSIQPRALAAMADSFGRTARRPAGLGKLAAGAATALLVGSMFGCGDAPPPVTEGIRPDLPPTKDAPKSPAPTPPEPAPGE
jgi:hypothetical protein